jgi:hypothetical protein
MRSAASPPSFSRLLESRPSQLFRSFLASVGRQERLGPVATGALFRGTMLADAPSAMARTERLVLVEAQVRTGETAWGRRHLEELAAVNSCMHGEHDNIPTRCASLSLTNYNN